MSSAGSRKLRRPAERGTLHNIFFLLLGSFFSRVGLEFALVLVARAFAESVYGRFAAAFALANMFIIHADLGMSQYMISVGSPDRRKVPACLGNTLLVFGVASLALCPLIVLIGALLGYSGKELLLVGVLSAYAVGMSGERIGMAVLQIFGRAGLSGHVRTARALVLLTAVAATLALTAKLVVVALAFSLTSLVACCLYAVCVVRHVTPRVDLRALRTMLRGSSPFWLLEAFASIYLFSGVVVLQYVAGDVVAGNYAAASRLIIAVVMLPATVCLVVLPKMYEAAARTLAELRALYERLSRFLVAAGVIVAALIALYACDLTAFLYKEGQFPETALALRLLSLFVVLKFFNFGSGILILALGRVKDRVRLVALVAGESIALGFVLMSHLGLVGACVTAIAAEVTLTIGYALLVARAKCSLPVVHVFGKPVAAACLASLLMIFLRSRAGWAASLVAGGVLYALVLLLVRFVTVGEVRALLRRERAANQR